MLVVSEWIVKTCGAGRAKESCSRVLPGGGLCI